MEIGYTTEQEAFRDELRAYYDQLLDEETVGNDGGKGQRNGLKKQRTTEKPVRDHNMFGDRMAGSNDEISSELPTRRQVRCSC